MTVTFWKDETLSNQRSLIKKTPNAPAQDIGDTQIELGRIEFPVARHAILNSEKIQQIPILLTQLPSYDAALPS